MDPVYPRKNYNKPAKQTGETPFTWNERCNLANRIYRKKDAELQILEYKKAHGILT